MQAVLRSHEPAIDAGRGDLALLKLTLEQRREFLLRLLENPNLLEHETLTEMLWSVFHLADELAHRPAWPVCPTRILGTWKTTYDAHMTGWSGSGCDTCSISRHVPLPFLPRRAHQPLQPGREGGGFVAESAWKKFGAMSLSHYPTSIHMARHDLTESCFATAAENPARPKRAGQSLLLRPMARALRIAMFEREVRERLSRAALDTILAHAEVISEGQRAERNGQDSYLGSTMVTVDLESLGPILREPGDAGTAQRLAALLRADSTIKARMDALAAREVLRVAGARAQGRAHRESRFVRKGRACSSTLTWRRASDGQQHRAGIQLSRQCLGILGVAEASYATGRSQASSARRVGEAADRRFTLPGSGGGTRG